MGATSKPADIHPEQSGWIWNVLLTLLCALYVALRVRGLASIPLWHDEAFSALFARMGWRDMFRAIISDAVHPPLFYILLKGWITHRTSVLWMRLLPFLFSLFTLPPLFLICRELGFPRPAIVLTLALASINEQLVRYSQELRMYSLVLFLSVVSLWLFLRFTDRGRGLVWLTLTNLLLVYVHYYAWLFVGTEAIAIVLWGIYRNERTKIVSFAFAMLFLLAAFSPWAYLVARVFHSRHVLQENLGWITVPTVGDIASLYDKVNGSLQFRHAVSLSLVLFLIPVVLGFAGKAENRPRLIGLALFAFLPTLAAFIASHLLPSAVFGERYLVIVVVPYLLLVTMGIFSTSPPPTRKLFAAAAILWSVWAGISYFRFPIRNAPWVMLLHEIPIQNIPDRATISLNGPWQAIVDPYETGLSAHFYLDAKLEDHEPIEYDFDKADVLYVPEDWNSQKKELFFYEGPVWYKKPFSYRKREHTRVFAYFGAANYFTRVYLNGQLLGQHEGGFTPFNFEITDKIREGGNFLVAEVSNARRRDGVPSMDTDWWNYGGLTRDVMLVEVPENFIQDYFVQLAKGSSDQISGWVQLGDFVAGRQVTVEIPEAGIRKIFATDGLGQVRFHFPAKLELWSPENPKLYDVVVSSGSDKVRDAIGFRTVETRGTQVLLNGKPIFLRGISLPEEAPGHAGQAFGPEDAETLLGWARELHCNFVRLTHYPRIEDITRLADRLGLMVWSEIPVYWDIAWENPATLQNAQNQLREMIARDHNRASILFWSLSNETPNKPARLTFLRQLARNAHLLDSTRLVTSVMSHVDDSGPDVRVFNDPLGEYLDVLGFNEYLSGSVERPGLADMQWKTMWDKPIIISEFGAGTSSGRDGEADERWTEEYQANLYQHQINMLRKIPSLAGLSPWVPADFHSPERLLPGVQDYYNRKELASSLGEHKQVHYVLQKVHREIEPAKEPGAAVKEGPGDSR
jgi:beta-glucuronidase